MLNTGDTRRVHISETTVINSYSKMQREREMNSWALSKMMTTHHKHFLGFFTMLLTCIIKCHV
jgi:hypothetical protein